MRGILLFSFFKAKKSKLLVINQAKSAIEVSDNETILLSALRHDIAIPNSCRVGGCASCKCKLIKGQVKELTESSYVLSAEELSQGYILACQSVAKSDVEIEVDLASISQGYSVISQQGIVKRQWQLTHDIIGIEVELANRLDYVAGQYANISLPTLSSAVRSYSFATQVNTESNLIQFFIKHVEGGELSPKLFDEKLTELPIEIEGPYGDFYLRISDKPIICIAGGSGLAPIKALLEQAKIDKVKRDITILFGAKEQRDLYCMDDLSALSGSWLGKFSLIPVLSNEPELSNWQGKRGFVTEILSEVLIGDEQAYLCGPPVMIDAAITVLKNHSIISSNIFFDKFLSKADLTKQSTQLSAIEAVG